MATPVLVDSNVLPDISTEDPAWFDWSSAALEEAADESPLLINPLIYAEISMAYERIEDLERAVPRDVFRRDPLPYEAGFSPAKRSFDRRSAVARDALLCLDFYIGAQAAAAGLRLLTRDPKRYRTYFPTVTLIAPAG